MNCICIKNNFILELHHSTARNLRNVSIHNNYRRTYNMYNIHYIKSLLNYTTITNLLYKKKKCPHNFLKHIKLFKVFSMYSLDSPYL